MKQFKVIKVHELPVMNVLAEMMKGLNYPPSFQDVQKAKRKYITLASLLN